MEPLIRRHFSPDVPFHCIKKFYVIHYRFRFCTEQKIFSSVSSGTYTSGFLRYLNSCIRTTELFPACFFSLGNKLPGDSYKVHRGCQSPCSSSQIHYSFFHAHL